MQPSIADDVDKGLDAFSDLLSAIYETAYDHTTWPKAVGLLRDRLNANFVTLIIRPETSEDAGAMITAGQVFESYSGLRTQYSYPSPFVDLVSDKVYTVSDLMREDEWRQSSFYRHFCEDYGVFHVMAADIRTLDNGEFKIRVTRPEGGAPFGVADKTALARLLPHLKRALNIQTRSRASESVGLLYTEAVSRMMVATMILDEKGQLLQSNQIASDLLAEGDGLKLYQGKLVASYSTESRELQNLINQSLARQQKPQTADSMPAMVEAMSLSRPSGRVNLGVVVKAVPSNEWVGGRQRPAVMVYVRDADKKTEVPLKVTQQLFGLTPAESLLAVHLANGLSLEEAAEELGIRHNTARAHLRSIFSKTGVRRQTELVRIMLNSVSALGQPPAG
ncbi:helix-turn-helix transcriptional regulator [Craterilacuibacter sp. RT1T]|uniref:helix-turn-helix transcriptional regulator n=1 Tax=Craterilacuibacter sp. RT1T TaxID=2942211 RepID=UPI0020BF7314|nr:helix-turn-helix transcriptional regulator [Craterilacuibacter sp. RT1T]MCL6263255.1 helix-turn-helix transcriptional regulator [Craterilacuibacter sp. RT1T]